MEEMISMTKLLNNKLLDDICSGKANPEEVDNFVQETGIDKAMIEGMKLGYKQAEMEDVVQNNKKEIESLKATVSDLIYVIENINERISKLE